MFALRCPKVLITIVLLISWLEPFEFQGGQWDMVDLFAGVARISRLGRAHGKKCAAMDIGYHENRRVFDINEEPGFVLAVMTILEGTYEEVFACLGVCCSSWVSTSRGSTHRSWILPMGWQGYQTVEAANKMVSRTVLIVMVILAMRGVWLLEQPSSSLIMRHDRFVEFQDLMQALQMRFFRQSFWMRALGHQTAKRTLLWSNTAWLVDFDLGRLARDKLRGEVQTTDRYKSRDGRSRWKGNKNLKSTQTLGWALTTFVCARARIFLCSNDVNGS
ncbi:Uncharacterized protein SCF082_LOCUS26595 [Durusdinium trenchii]|uniref:Uncharacterized protein n=1 Tax=Durusdinium trenchii TaxID=1381693 RepID=A0ABP0M7N7_9DINO